MSNPETLLSKVYGKYCWDISWDSQLNLHLNFGKPCLSIREPSSKKPDKRYVRPKGEWWLWVWLAHWKLTLPGRETITGSSRWDRMTMGLFYLEGQILVDARVNASTGFTSLSFDLGGLLEIRRMSAREVEEIWSLHQPDGYVLTLHGDGSFTNQQVVKNALWGKDDGI